MNNLGLLVLGKRKLFFISSLNDEMSENEISAIRFLFESRHSKLFVLKYSLKRESLMAFLSESEVVEVG